MECSLDQLVEKRNEHDAHKTGRNGIREGLQTVLQVGGNRRKDRNLHCKTDCIVNNTDRQDAGKDPHAHLILITDPSVIGTHIVAERDEEEIRAERKIALSVRDKEESDELAQQVARGRRNGIVEDHAEDIQHSADDEDRPRSALQCQKDRHHEKCDRRKCQDIRLQDEHLLREEPFSSGNKVRDQIRNNISPKVQELSDSHQRQAAECHIFCVDTP